MRFTLHSLKQVSTVHCRLYAVAAGVWLLIASLSAAARAADDDWPMWRHDASRSGTTSLELADKLHLQWVRELPTPEPAWPDQAKLDFDDHYEPVVADGRLFIGSPLTDRLTAYRTDTGEELWHFQADGPIRFAPAVADGRVFFTSDDGYLYCLAADSGQLLWRFRGGPSDRKILGNHRLISTWPARGAPVVADGVVYFAASIWPFMGVFVHAVDAETGAAIWTNDGTGSIFIKQPHDSDSFAGIAPQGPLVVAGNRLLVPGGRSVPACFDRHSGKLLYYHLAANKRIGGWRVSANDRFFFNGGRVFELETGRGVETIRGSVVFDDQRLYNFDNTFDPRYNVFSLADAKVVVERKKDRRGRVRERFKLDMDELAEIEAPGGDALLKAGSRIYGGTTNRVVAIELTNNGESDSSADEHRDSDDDDDNSADDEEESNARIVWEAEVEGPAVRLIAADDRLFVVTRRGKLYCFGREPRQVVEHPLEIHPLQRDGSYRQRVERLIAETGAQKGYAICWGVGSGQLIAELLDQTELNLVVLDPDADRVAAFRNRAIQAGIYGRRVAALVADPLQIELPPYMANLIVSEDISAAGFAPTPEHMQSLFHPLRPYGGTACLLVPEVLDEQITGLVETSELENAGVQRVGEYLLLSRNGALPGAGNWTHEHADAANTRVSTDRRVKAPLGILWFGGPTNEGVLPRHGHGPQPQVIDGRLIIEGVDLLRAVDIYNGTLLWQRELEGLGEYYNNFSHQPGANATGSNYVSTSDGIYVVYQGRCLRLDPATGQTVATFEIPPLTEDDNGQHTWGYINVAGDFLIAGADPLLVYTDAEGRPKKGRSENFTASKWLVVMNRHNGTLLWKTEAVNYFRHNAICVGGGRLYAVDLLTEAQLARLKRRGQQPTTQSRLVAFDLATGDTLWTTDQGVFGTWLSYSEPHDVLVESGRGGRDTLRDEPRGMRAFRGADGTVLWKADYGGPAMIHGDRIINQSQAIMLLTGEPAIRLDPITGEPVPWRWFRHYGCNTPMASTHLLTFRSGAAGFFDLAGDGGTGNFGGFRSGCTNNLVVAGGVLSAPDYTRSCTCAYQNQTSLALVPMPDVEMWTELPLAAGKNLKQLGVNLGAPGFRRDDSGLLWVHRHKQAQVDFDQRLGLYRHHASRVEGPLPWVAASGCRGVSRVTIDPRFDDTIERPVSYRVRLVFADPDNDQPRQRRMRISMQGKVVEPDLDVVAASGGRYRTLVREYAHVEVTDKLVIELEPLVDSPEPAHQPAHATVVCGIEVRRE